jgi:hypothetical protein
MGNGTEPGAAFSELSSGTESGMVVKPRRGPCTDGEVVRTFAPTGAIVRRELRSQYHFSMSRAKSEVVELPRSLLEHLTDAGCYAA